MPFTIKLLGASQLTTTQAAVYTVPGAPTTSAIVSNIRLVNTNGSTAATVNVFYHPATGATVRLLEIDKSIAANDIVVIKPELTLATGDKIEAKVNSGNIVDCVISGMERS